MKIALCLDRWDPRRGGLEAYAAMLHAELLRRGHELAILTACYLGQPMEGQSRSRVEIVEESGAAFYAAADRRQRALEVEGYLTLAFRHAGPAHVFCPLGGLLRTSLDARRRSEVPGLRHLRASLRRLSKRTSLFLAREDAFFDEAANSGGRLCLANSPLVADDIRRRYPRFAGTIEVVGLPVDLQRFSLPTRAERKAAREALGLGDAVAILFIGNDPRRKGLGAALAVLERLRARRLDARLVLAGHGSARWTSAKRGILGLGFVEDIAGLYHACDVLLAPSLEDNLSFCGLEALATGLPVVTTRQNGVAAWVAGAKLARVVDDARCVSDLDAATLALLDRSALASELRSARRALIQSCESRLHFDAVELRLSRAVASLVLA
mgnify:CR=1 FL=1